MDETSKVRTVRDAIRENIESEARMGVEDRADSAARKLPSYIGQLCRNGRTVHYAYINGVYREGSVEHLSGLATR